MPDSDNEKRAEEAKGEADLVEEEKVANSQQIIDSDNATLEKRAVEAKGEADFVEEEKVTNSQHIIDSDNATLEKRAVEAKGEADFVQEEKVANSKQIVDSDGATLEKRAEEAKGEADFVEEEKVTNSKQINNIDDATLEKRAEEAKGEADFVEEEKVANSKQINNVDDATLEKHAEEAKGEADFVEEEKAAADAGGDLAADEEPGLEGRAMPGEALDAAAGGSSVSEGAGSAAAVTTWGQPGGLDEDAPPVPWEEAKATPPESPMAAGSDPRPPSASTRRAKEHASWAASVFSGLARQSRTGQSRPMRSAGKSRAQLTASALAKTFSMGLSSNFRSASMPTLLEPRQERPLPIAPELLPPSHHALSTGRSSPSEASSAPRVPACGLRLSPASSRGENGAAEALRQRSEVPGLDMTRVHMGYDDDEDESCSGMRSSLFRKVGTSNVSASVPGDVPRLNIPRQSGSVASQGVPESRSSSFPAAPRGTSVGAEPMALAPLDGRLNPGSEASLNVRRGSLLDVPEQNLVRPPSRVGPLVMRRRRSSQPDFWAGGPPSRRITIDAAPGNGNFSDIPTTCMGDVEPRRRATTAPSLRSSPSSPLLARPISSGARFAFQDSLLPPEDSTQEPPGPTSAELLPSVPEEAAAGGPAACAPGQLPLENARRRKRRQKVPVITQVHSHFHYHYHVYRKPGAAAEAPRRESRRSSRRESLRAPTEAESVASLSGGLAASCAEAAALSATAGFGVGGLAEDEDCVAELPEDAPSM